MNYTADIFHFDVCKAGDCKLHGLTNCEAGDRLTEQGSVCVFPFIKDGVEHFDCIQHDTVVGLEQCATKVDPCACTMDGFSGLINTGKVGCVEGGGKESIDLHCQSEHGFAGSDTWCYVRDPVACNMMTAAEREIQGLVDVSYYHSINILGTGWRYCSAEEVRGGSERSGIRAKRHSSEAACERSSVRAKQRASEAACKRSKHKKEVVRAPCATPICLSVPCADRRRACASELRGATYARH